MLGRANLQARYIVRRLSRKGLGKVGDALPHGLAH
jgi:hypothetical protein